MMEKLVGVNLLKMGEIFADIIGTGGDHQLKSNFPIARHHQLCMFTDAKLMQTQCGIHHMAYSGKRSTIL